MNALKSNTLPILEKPLHKEHCSLPKYSPLSQLDYMPLRTSFYMSNTVYLGLGSNMGDSIAIIQQALTTIAQIPHVEILRTSSLYQTSPVGSLALRDFINCVCALNTTLSPEELYEALHHIEVSLGKIPKEKNAPRPIDIDILIFGTFFYRTQELCIPHLHWQ